MAKSKRLPKPAHNNNRKSGCIKLKGTIEKNRRRSTGVKKPPPVQNKLSSHTQASFLRSIFSTAKKVYTTKLGSAITLTAAIPCRFNHSGQLIGTILSTSNKPLLVTWDTGAGCSMIERRHLSAHFSPLPKIHNEKSFHLSGVGNFALTQMTQYVSLPVRIVTDDDEIVTFECRKVWIVENYLVDEAAGKVSARKEAQILIGNDFLRNYRLGIEWGERGTRDYLRYKGIEGEFVFPCLSHKESHGT